MVRDATSEARLRHVSGGGRPINNRVDVGGQLRAMGPHGYVGFFLKTTEADLQIGIGVDDGMSGGGTGLEASTLIPAIADGRWHLYQWNLADADQWSSFSNGNGAIDGPNAYMDSLFFHTGASTAGKSISFFIDTVAYNPHGSLAALATDYLADFDGDWSVDADDLAAWRQHFAVDAAGDADDDGDSDGADFLAWQRQLGNQLPGVTAATVVVEPASMALAAVAAAAMRRRRRRISSTRRSWEQHAR
jgi:MYXO-CTERM domain-containing protein